MARKKKPEEAENLERWMVSYADFVTLLFAFFTCLYAISNVDAQKMGQMVASMRESFGGQIFDASSKTIPLSDAGGGTGPLSGGPTMSESEAEAARRKRQQEESGKTILDGDADMSRFKRNLEAILGEEIKKNLVSVYLERRGVIIRLSETGMFDSGSDVVRPEGIAMLDKIATSLTNVGNQVRIEGHTDSIPINTARFPSNWELSQARAGTVLRRMIGVYGMSPELLGTTGYSEYRPVASNDTIEGRARNRRVDIIVLNPSFALAEPI